MCTHTHASHARTEPLFPPVHKAQGKEASLLSPTCFPGTLTAPPVPPLQTPTLIREAAAGTKEPEQTRTKQETQKHILKIPQEPNGPSHTPTTQGASRMGEGFRHSERYQEKTKKGQQSASLLSAQTEPRGGCWGQSHQSDDCLLPILSSSKAWQDLACPQILASPLPGPPPPPASITPALSSLGSGELSFHQPE